MANPDSPADAAATHRLVVFAAPDDPHALRDLLADRLKLHATDAQIHAHAVPGVLPDSLSREQATELAEAIQSLGVAAAAIPTDEVPVFDHAEVIHHVRCLENGLEIVELHGEPECVLEWAEIGLISVGYVPQESSRHYEVGTTTFLHSAPTPPHGSHDFPSTSALEAWLIRREPLRGYRIEHNQMNYEYLGTRKTTSATHNFRLFLNDLFSRTPHAYLTPAARAYKEHGLLRHYQFHSFDEHRRYTVFHLLLLERMSEASRGH